MSVSVITTNPFGRSFLSYRRARAAEAEMLIRAQRERGIPTWQDIVDLNEEHTESELRRVLESADTANAILWITPEVADSTVIRRVEAPLILNRADRQDPFFVVPVAGGGLDYKEAAKAVDECLTLPRLEEWNIRKVKENPATLDEIRGIACRVLERRVKALHAEADPGQPVQLGLFARSVPPESHDYWLAMDWTGRIVNRHASDADWQVHLLPALTDVVSALEKHAPGRRILASGRPTLAAAFAAGRAFLAPRGIEVCWRQFTNGRGECEWHLNDTRHAAPLSVKITGSDTGADDLAVLVSITGSVEHAWAATRDSLPAFRGVVSITYGGDNKQTLTSSEALDIAHSIVDAVREAREQLMPKGAIHLFLAVPVGLAFLFGQLSNTLGPIWLYEHEESTAIGHYVPGPKLSV